MSSSRQASRIRTIALLLSGVLPLAIQPSALAGQIVASRNVDRMVADLPNPISIDELVRLLSREARDETGSSESQTVPGDVMSVIVQCKLLSLMSDSAALQAPDVDINFSGLAPEVESAGLSRPPMIDRVLLDARGDGLPTRRLSDEQPLGP